MIFLTNPPDDVMGLVGDMVAAAKGGNWSLFVSLLIMILVFVFTKVPMIDSFLERKGAKVWVASVAGMLAAFSSGLYASAAAGEPIEWLQLSLNGLAVGLAAGGLWDLLGRKLLGKKEEAFNDDPEPEE